jgi:hypothetical protein
MAENKLPLDKPKGENKTRICCSFVQSPRINTVIRGAVLAKIARKSGRDWFWGYLGVIFPFRLTLSYLFLRFFAASNIYPLIPPFPSPQVPQVTFPLEAK